MRYSFFTKQIAAYFLFVLHIFFLSCSSESKTETLNQVTYKQSLDFAKVHESGPSRIIYIQGAGVNYVSYTETTLFGFKFYGTANKNEDDLNPGLNPATDPSIKNGYSSIGYGLEYINKGAKFPGGGGKIGLNYIEVPVDFIYHYPIGPGLVYGGLGPYFAYGVGGRSGGESSYGENNGGFRRFDAGLGMMLGYKLNMGLSLGAGYDLGLANVEYPDQDVKGYNRCFSINLGYQVGKLFVKNKK